MPGALPRFSRLLLTGLLATTPPFGSLLKVGTLGSSLLLSATPPASAQFAHARRAEVREDRIREDRRISRRTARRVTRRTDRRIHTLPVGARPVFISGATYYEAGGVYWEPVYRGGTTVYVQVIVE